MARPNTDSERVNVYIPRRIMKVLRVLAQRRGTTYSEMIRQASREFAIREANKENEENVD